MPSMLVRSTTYQLLSTVLVRSIKHRKENLGENLSAELNDINKSKDKYYRMSEDELRNLYRQKVDPLEKSLIGSILLQKLGNDKELFADYVSGRIRKL